MSDRRTELRFGADQPVLVCALAPIPGKIDGMSKSGLRRVIVMGQVRYCQKTGPRKYSIGLKIMEVVGAGKLLQIKPNAA